MNQGKSSSTGKLLLGVIIVETVTGNALGLCMKEDKDQMPLNRSHYRSHDPSYIDMMCFLGTLSVIVRKRVDSLSIGGA